MWDRLTRDDDPVMFFEPKRAYRSVREQVGAEPVPLGVARVDRPGDDVSVVTYGIGVHLARPAADLVAGEVVRLGADDCHIAYNAPEEDAVIPTAGRVAEAVRMLAAF